MQPRAWDLVRRRFALWTLTLSCVLGLAAYLFSGRPLALSFLAGALIGALNLSILAGSADRLLRAVQDVPNVPAGTGGRAARAWALMRWPSLALATAAVLWYMPGRPDGLAAGVFTALAAFSGAALQSRADLSRDDLEPDR
jgi:hypothetical protein